MVGLLVVAALGIGSTSPLRRVASAHAVAARPHTDHVEQMMLVQTTVVAARRAVLAEEAVRTQAERASRNAVRGVLGRFTVTCYALSGTTASGRRVSSNVVAVDPRVIPIGTRIHIGGVGP